MAMRRRRASRSPATTRSIKRECKSSDESLTVSFVQAPRLRSHAKRQGRIGTVEKLNRGEPQVSIANIFKIVDLVFSLPIDEVTGLTDRKDGFDDRPIPHTATGKILKTALRDQFKSYSFPNLVASPEVS
ncbi:hypothetical protein QA640_47520 (plasmid) [Bradyrhizobium sp. CB82]|uniref:hypothetical protein n=1 Tax=Bradyrhizobium sp. CB82 TaxID=3039159 RepID=UPI0024B06AEA|nr:hypothetical protein [Bradyrhizobium sp. CB82]WFU46151.1 hypothetical protein QA640_47520 [Bradyrhizobium sp. CB82]